VLKRPSVAWLFLMPALLLLVGFLVYPVANTLYLSLIDESTGKLSVANYAYLFTSSEMLIVFRNNVMWLTLFTGATVTLGLLFAVLMNQVRYEPVAKAIIFVPMAVSFTATAVIWRFMYVFKPPGFTQIGVVNALVDYVGGTPIPWIIDKLVNNPALIVAGVWMWTGFALVVISAGLKGISTEVVEAARVDGASEWQLFRYIILPMLKPVIVVVAVTLTINALKVFDLVYVMTFGNFDTDVLANRMFKEMFTFGNFGRASAIAVILLVLIVPFMLFNIGRFRQEA
jgi:alpha-glucoside transport system permease protein